ncbi:MAG: family 20 glycosylhydrolase [Armatimonadetes bacterium]|nr:family 20 glycosylhydrolase [Armatimonadota bacterium]
MWTILAGVALTVAAPDLHLVPTPKTVKVREGGFSMVGRSPVWVCNSSPDDAYAAEMIIADSAGSFRWRDRKTQPYVTVGRTTDAAIAPKLRLLNLSLPADAGKDAYIVSVRPKQIVCAGKSAAGTYYAVQTLRQLIRANMDGSLIPSVDIVDWPSLEMRGWQDDVSRGPIPNLAFLKKQVKELSHYKLNAFTLYTEHVFRLEKHPRIAPKDGLTADDIKDLDRYCKKHHVQLIGNFQSFGHFANILSVKGYEKLGETPNVISPAKEESYAFLKDVYDEIAPAYTSKLFNINCDETYGLGEGASKEMVKKDGLGNVYAKHINRVNDLLKKHGKTCMMWGDIALQYPDIRKNLPKDLIVLTWGYHPGASFVDQIKPFTQMGYKFLVCPGVSCWGQIYPDLDAATVNISNFVRDGAANGAMGMLNTTWDDTGENLFNNNWFPLVWGAEVSWTPAPDISDTVVPMRNGINGTDLTRQHVPHPRVASFNEAFPRLFYGLKDGKLSRAFWRLSRLRAWPLTNGLSDQAFWRAPWDTDPRVAAAAADPGFAKETSDVLSMILKAKAEASRNAETLDAALVAGAKAAYLFAQAKVVAELPNFMKIAPASRAESAREAAESLASQLKTLRSKYEAAWKAECRPWWLDRNLAKFDKAIADTSSLATVPLLEPNGGSFSGKTEVKVLSMDESGEVRYTLDGSEPTDAAHLYTGPVQLEKSARLRVKRFLPGGVATPSVMALFTRMTRPCKIETPWTAYGDHAPGLAFDGLDDTYFWSYGQPSAGSSFTVVFDEADLVPGLTVTTGHPDHPDDYVHEGVLEVSPDGQKWREMAKFEKGVAKTGMIGFNVKAVRIRLTKDNGNWLVVREIAIP